MDPLDLTGSWLGHYEQNGGRHSISMRVVQRGQSFVGSMRDADTVLASRGTLHAEAADGSASTPPVVLGQADVLSTLPEHSLVEGEVDGCVATFVKSYQGTTSTSVQLDDGTSAAYEAPGHDVHYVGTLDAAGNELAGHWAIHSRDGGPVQRDRFLLRRVTRRTTPPRA